MERNLLTIYRQLTSVASQVGSVLNVARSQNYNREDVYPDKALDMLARDPEMWSQYEKDLIAAMESITWIREEVSARHAALLGR